LATRSGGRTRDEDQAAVKGQDEPGAAARPDAEAEAVERSETLVRLLGIPAPGEEEEVKAVEDGWPQGGWAISRSIS
jgi:hypothetical protein